MTDHHKLTALIEAIGYLASSEIDGDIVECGVWRGGSMMAAALALTDAGDTSRDLFLFDTYEGLPSPEAIDRRVGDLLPAAEVGAEFTADGKRWAEASLDDVAEGMRSVGYPPELVHYVKGLVEDTLPDAAPEQIALLRLDTDWYRSTAHELAHLYPRLVHGGVLILDDYGHWDGARRAVDEYLAGLDHPLLLHRCDNGRVAVKP